MGLATNEKYGEMRRGSWCDDPLPLTWTAQMVEAVAAPFAATARTELKRLGYAYLEEETSAFDAKQRSSADYEIGATIRAIDVQLCTGSRRENAGGVWLDIKWELFAPRLQQVVYTLTAEGSFASGVEECAG